MSTYNLSDLVKQLTEIRDRGGQEAALVYLTYDDEGEETILPLTRLVLVNRPHGIIEEIRLETIVLVRHLGPTDSPHWQPANSRGAWRKRSFSNKLRGGFSEESNKQDNKDILQENGLSRATTKRLKRDYNSASPSDQFKLKQEMIELT